LHLARAPQPDISLEGLGLESRAPIADLECPAAPGRVPVTGNGKLASISPFAVAAVIVTLAASATDGDVAVVRREAVEPPSWMVSYSTSPLMVAA
jgi:hypothetical protein